MGLMFIVLLILSLWYNVIYSSLINSGETQSEQSWNVGFTISIKNNCFNWGWLNLINKDAEHYNRCLQRTQWRTIFKPSSQKFTEHSVFSLAGTTRAVGVTLAGVLYTAGDLLYRRPNGNQHTHTGICTVHFSARTHIFNLSTLPPHSLCFGGFRNIDVHKLSVLRGNAPRTKPPRSTNVHFKLKTRKQYL